MKKRKTSQTNRTIGRAEASVAEKHQGEDISDVYYLLVYRRPGDSSLLNFVDALDS